MDATAFCEMQCFSGQPDLNRYSLITAGLLAALASTAVADPSGGRNDAGTIAFIEQEPGGITKRVADAAAVASLPVSQSAPIAMPPHSMTGRRCANQALDARTIRQMIDAEAGRQRVDAKLALAIADEESGFGANVNSAAGARGVMQLMPATAAHYGVRDICDAAQNIRGGIAFLKDLNITFDGNIMLMVAAYNSGEARVLKSGGIPSTSETVNYTARVTNAYYGFDNPLRRRNHAKANAFADERHPLSPDVYELSAEDVSNEIPVPINQSKSKTEAGRQQWIGGSVLYVE